MHSDCLAKAGQELNTDGKRYGMGGMGARAGCPVCNQPVSMWCSYDEAAEFPLFWTKHIFDILESIGPSGGPVKWKQVCTRLVLDENTTERQKSFMYEEVLNEALREGMSKYYVKEVDGGIRNGGYEKSGMRKNVWYWNEQTNEMWLYKWGKVPKRMIMKSPRRPTGFVIRNQRQQQHQWEWPLGNQYATIIVFVVAAIMLSIYFDTGEEITW